MELLHVTKENIEKTIKENETLIVDFWAPWCGPCRMLTPVLQQLADSGVCPVGKVNVDEEDELSQLFNVRSIPTLVLYKNGKIVDKKVGYADLENLTLWVKSYE